jgi:hypothetical protein
MSVVKKSSFGNHVGSFLPKAIGTVIDNFEVRDFSVLRILAKAPSVDIKPGLESYGQSKPVMAPALSTKTVRDLDTASSDYNLITSFVQGAPVTHPDATLHAPVLDLDIPCELIPSTQPGHWHLYINKPITWEKYRLLLNGLRSADLIEKGYYDSAVSRKYTAVRPVSRVKPGLIQRTTYYIKMAAVLRRENYYIKAVNEKLCQHVEALEAILRLNELEVPESFIPKDDKPSDPSPPETNVISAIKFTAEETAKIAALYKPGNTIYNSGMVTYTTQANTVQAKTPGDTSTGLIKTSKPFWEITAT